MIGMYAVLQLFLVYYDTALSNRAINIRHWPYLIFISSIMKATMKAYPICFLLSVEHKCLQLK